MNIELISMLNTPCVVIDEVKTKENLKKMQDIADNNNCLLRPHIKTHKTKYFANMQMKYGACGITCAKVSEAEVMADGGLLDIFIAYPLVGKSRIERALELLKRVKRLILAVDSKRCANDINVLATEYDVTVEVRLEVDTGAKRTGVLLQNCVDLAFYVSKLSNLKLTGVYTFKSLIFNGLPTTDKHIAGVEEGKLMNEIVCSIRNAGVNITDVSAGSTPTGEEVALTGLVNEIRPGTYIFNDYMLFKEEICNIEDIAVRMYATVVSTPDDSYAVIDGGTKTFPMDILLDVPPYFYDSYAVFEGNDNLQLHRMNEEHGIITSKTGKTGLTVGDIVCLIPVHVCTAINMQNDIYIYDGKNIITQKVDARGMLS